MGAGAVRGQGQDSRSNLFNLGSTGSTSRSSSQANGDSIFSSSTSSSSDNQLSQSNSQMKMSCEMCSVNFTLFKRKKCCIECRRYFCSNCLPKPPPNSLVGRQCDKCRLLISGSFSRDDLKGWKVKYMRCFLNTQNISTKDCTEKHDLIELILAQFCKNPNLTQEEQAEHEILVRQMAAHVRNVSFINEGTQQPGNSGEITNITETTPAETLESAPAASTDAVEDAPHPTNSESHFDLSDDRLRELSETSERLAEAFLRLNNLMQEEETTTTSTSIRRTQIDDIKDISEIDDLKIRQLKELLVNNFVDYKGCCEKAELIERVKRLWRDHQTNKFIAEQIHKEEETAYLGEKLKSTTVNESGDSASKLLPPACTDSESVVTSDNLDAAIADSTSAPLPAPPSSKPASDAPSTSATKSSDDSLCNICMDALVDCILLECGHMVTCTQCGKRLADCPICRQYIVRVVRVFRS
ncbi:E3 ubiquitin-protein ligase RNF34-like [Physella acuta]|uniref:E3 ubiquitin-protein ligase RNF34-like n=1 Tax=Physella acuta TaxID=109671 RepID=UPI0027DCAC9C|nr:E3 ubiquitin-protein ligase RNF34-like [Physella acuta]XP_059145265.1 E3 ubiquitin-protein ligase RNF34-like [Physella acuta]XP_059145266.1 E3 ubiquitin-protein ligase RNF34-like [Physella acuta]XP_059145267.1 E3 ubiquitin-protein ligase RNF34-like [Physella acuta]XP_059145268.1 E3 ubiquitin-protein ligase RNF34-like [Physella acuta]XP_059145269.1 E3 ubiquitin-protein ligase RNF34-like [Physella acuta]